MKRRIFLASAASVLTGCGPIGSALNNNAAVRRVLTAAEGLNHALIGTRGMARLYGENDVDRIFRVNGFATPSDAQYQRLVADDFSSYRLIVRRSGRTPASFYARTARADAAADADHSPRLRGRLERDRQVEGVPLGALLEAVTLRAEARYVVFRCMDNDGQGNPFYESLDLHQARHPQALLALRLNDAPLDPDHGAPVRLRVPTQLGYKSAKWIARIEVVGTFATIAGGQGGYWEDQGYEWYAGI